ncbi:MAG TPA: sugar phosphate nucleotidyltransferase [Candidatus Thermoplasmatota archaeon]|nr:sugar phosphate nucleotidyltransferase [Candidatus Thermoplasmatota archaeon]
MIRRNPREDAAAPDGSDLPGSPTPLYAIARLPRRGQRLRAILLAAGEGSRLRPYTVDKPKPMVRAANKPIAQHVVEALVANGVKDVTFVVGYHRATVQSHFGDGRRFGARIDYAPQEALTGTAAALAAVPRPKEPFLVLNADNVIDAALVKAVLSAHDDGPAVAVHRSEVPSRYGVAVLDGARVERILEKPRDPPSEWVNTGVYRLPPGAHDLATRLAAHTGAGLTDVLQAMLDDGTRVEGVKTEGLWSDAVYPWDLLRVHADVLAAGLATERAPAGVEAGRHVLVGEECSFGPGVVLGTGTCVGDNVEIGPHCVLENCVVYGDVKIGAGSILQNTIVGEGTRIGPRFTALSGPCEARTSDGWHKLDDFGAVIGEDARIGGCATTLPGAVVGNRTRLAPGRALSGSVEDGSIVV